MRTTTHRGRLARRMANAISAFAVVWALASCTTAPTAPVAPTASAATRPAAPAAETPFDPLADIAAPVAAPREAIIEIGNGRFTNPSVLSSAAAGQVAGDINLRLDNADIREFIDIVLGDLLSVNYIVDANVEGTVSIQTVNPITDAELLPLFEEILASNNAALIRSGSLYRVVPRDLVAGNVALSTTELAGPGFQTRVIPLEFVSAQEMQRILEPVLGDPAAIRIDAARNTIIASGDSSLIDLVQSTIDLFDVDWLRGMSVGLYPLDNVNPGTLEQELASVLDAASGGEGGGLLGGIVRLVPLERLESLLVVSSTAAGLREVETWIRRLDRPGESNGRSLFVYPLQNAKATDLAPLLASVFLGDAGAAATGSVVAPGLTAVEIAPGGEGGSLGIAAAGAAGGAGGGLAVGGGDVQVIADDVRNSLIILASSQDYRMVESAIRKLDIVPLQVLIEASILEVTLRDDLSLGVEWFFRNSSNDEFDRFGRLDLGSPGIAALAPGFSYSVVDNADRVRVALNTLAAESEINVLSAPSLMVLDNQTATINVGDEIPVPTRQSISNVDPDSPTVNEIAFRQTGVTLSVTPRVNNSGLVTMEISQEVATAAATTTSNIDAPTIQNRLIDSVVAINSGETIVLGGLIQDQETTSESGVPGLYRLPVLGRLFGRKASENSRTELLVLITPRVVRNRDDAREVTEEFRRRLEQLRPVVPIGQTDNESG